MGGTITIAATSGTNVITLSDASLGDGNSCTFSVNVTGTALGQQNNTTGNVTSNEGGTGGTASASIMVTLPPPTISESFGAASIQLNGSTSLTFTIGNPNTNASLTGVGFSDTLPAGLVISTPNGLAGSISGGTITATQGTGVITLTDATLAAGNSGTFSVNVTGTAVGQQNNTTGNVTSNEGGTGGTASASITVTPLPPTISKSFGAASIQLNGSTSLTFTIGNPNTNASLTGVGFSDTLPAGLVISTPNGLTGSISGGRSRRPREPASSP